MLDCMAMAVLAFRLVWAETLTEVCFESLATNAA